VTSVPSNSGPLVSVPQQQPQPQQPTIMVQAAQPIKTSPLPPHSHTLVQKTQQPVYKVHPGTTLLVNQASRSTTSLVVNNSGVVPARGTPVSHATLSSAQMNAQSSMLVNNRPGLVIGRSSTQRSTGGHSANIIGQSGLIVAPSSRAANIVRVSEAPSANIIRGQSEMLQNRPDLFISPSYKNQQPVSSSGPSTHAQTTIVQLPQKAIPANALKMAPGGPNQTTTYITSGPGQRTVVAGAGPTTMVLNPSITLTNVPSSRTAASANSSNPGSLPRHKEVSVEYVRPLKTGAGQPQVQIKQIPPQQHQSIIRSSVPTGAILTQKTSSGVVRRAVPASSSIIAPQHTVHITTAPRPPLQPSANMPRPLLHPPTSTAHQNPPSGLHQPESIIYIQQEHPKSHQQPPLPPTSTIPTYNTPPTAHSFKSARSPSLTPQGLSGPYDMSVQPPGATIYQQHPGYPMPAHHSPNPHPTHSPHPHPHSPHPHPTHSPHPHPTHSPHLVARGPTSPPVHSPLPQQERASSSPHVPPIQPSGPQYYYPRPDPPTSLASAPTMVYSNQPPQPSAPPVQRRTALVQPQQQNHIFWSGILGLKTDSARVIMHFVSGSVQVAQDALLRELTTLKISQRMRLEPMQLDGVSRKLALSSEHAVLIAVANGTSEHDSLAQETSLNNSFINYLNQKQAAGIVNVMIPGTQSPAFVIHIFPPCDFARRTLETYSPDTLRTVDEFPHLLVVIATCSNASSLE